MGGRSRPIAVLDACTLYSVTLTDALLSFAVDGFFQAKWSRLIEAEWMSALERQRPELSGKLDGRRDIMRRAVPDWEVVVPRGLTTQVTVGLPDPDDLHVLQAAMESGADVIVTLNTHDFPPASMAALNIGVAHPDFFLLELWDRHPARGNAVLEKMMNRRATPPSNDLDFAEALRRSGLPRVAHRFSARREN